jgi:hypothetical protein
MTVSLLADTASTLPAGQGRADSALWRLNVAGKDFFVLRQRGSFPDIAYDHGRLLANEIDRGVFPEIVSTIRRGMDQDNEVLKRICAVVFDCFNKRVHANVSAEFRAATRALAEGYLAAATGSALDGEDVREVVLGIEVANLIEGLLHRLSLPVTRLYSGAALALQCLPYVFDKNVGRSLRVLGVAAVSPTKLHGSLKRARKPRHRAGYGCTALAVSAAKTADGKHLHARNLDGEMYSWNEVPVLFLIDETAGRRGWRKYAACGTAGLIYPGGISGINDAGLSVSLHQMSTTRYHSGFLFGQGAIAPYVEQRVLREAGTLDEAVDLVRSIRHFAAWTILCSEAATGKMVRIELNGDRVRVTRAEGTMAQTNHFIHPDMVERAFDASDGHFTPTFGKWLETRARFGLISGRLARTGSAQVNTDWAIECLASHEDWELEQTSSGQNFEGSALRSFGRTPVKTYGQLSSVVRGDPDRGRRHDEIWMTLGERRPAAHSTLLGWQIDWNALSLMPVAVNPMRRTLAQKGRPNWEQALQHYVQACIASTRPRDANGAYLNRARNKEETRRDTLAAIAELDLAIGLAAADAIEEVPFHYIRARLRHAAGAFAEASGDWRALLDLWEAQKARRSLPDAGQTPLIHIYEAALILTLSTATQDRLHGGMDWPGRAERIKEAKELFASVKAAHFSKRAHRDLIAWERCLRDIEARGGASAELPDNNFITVE